VQNARQILAFQNYDCNYLLLDTFNCKSYGGSGQSFDWGIVPPDIKPYFLAGGLNNQNVSKAIKLCNPYCVDVSSGVETNGLKNRDKK
jgi:phosphoribosylanthranilate isomerase